MTGSTQFDRDLARVLRTGDIQRLRTLHSTISDLLGQIKDFVPWPALIASLQADVDRVDALIKSHPEYSLGAKRMMGGAIIKARREAEAARAAL